MRSILYYEPAIVADGSDMTAQLATAFAAAAADRGRVLVPAGTYGVSGNILELTGGQRLEIWGEGVRSTIFTALEAFSDPVFYLNGASNSFQNSFTMSHCQFNTNSLDITWISAEYCAYMLLEHCLFYQNLGTSIHGLSLWDSHFNHLEFAGGGTSGVAAVHLANNPAGEANCNNVVFFNNRFEDLDGQGIYLGTDCRKCALIRCKFDRASTGVRFNGAKVCTITGGTQFTLSDIAVSGTAGQGMMLEGNIIDACTMGFDVGNSTQTIITANVFGLTLPNTTDYSAPSGTNVIANNILSV